MSIVYWVVLALGGAALVAWIIVYGKLPWLVARSRVATHVNDADDSDDLDRTTTKKTSKIVLPLCRRASPRRRHASREASTYRFWRHSADANDARRYPPVWIFVDRPARDRQCETSVRVFENAFCGYERLALLIAYTRLARTNNVLFVHRGNWHTYLPELPPNAATIDPALRRDAIKYQLLARYGGIWLTPRTIVTSDLNHLLHTHRERRGRRDIAILAGDRPATSAHRAVRVVDDRCIVCYPGNRVLQRLAARLQDAAMRYASYSGYRFEDYAAKTLQRYSCTAAYGALAHSLVLLGNDAAGVVDACGRRVTTTTLLATHPHACPPVHNMRWLCLDETELERQRNHAWFARISEEQLLHSQLWISHVYQHALRKTATESTATATTIVIRGDLNPLRSKWDASWTLRG